MGGQSGLSELSVISWVSAFQGCPGFHWWVGNIVSMVESPIRDLAFITKPDLASVSMNPACSPLKCQIPKPITPHPNRFECLVDRNPDMPVNHGNGNENPNSNPSPTPQTSTSSLLDRNPDVPVDHGNGNPNSNPSPTPQISTSKPRKATKKPQPQTASNRNPPIPKFYTSGQFPGTLAFRR